MFSRVGYRLSGGLRDTLENHIFRSLLKIFVYPCLIYLDFPDNAALKSFQPGF